MAMFMNNFQGGDYTFSQMITQNNWPWHFKIDPFKLKRATEKFLSYSQLEINFGKEFEISYIEKFNRFDLNRDIVTCVMCRKERELFDRLPFEYDGMDIILSPYSEVYGEVCVECFHKHDGWGIIRDSERRVKIKYEVLESRTVSESRQVLIEKIGYESIIEKS